MSSLLRREDIPKGYNLLMCIELGRLLLCGTNVLEILCKKSWTIFSPKEFWLVVHRHELHGIDFQGFLKVS